LLFTFYFLLFTFLIVFMAWFKSARFVVTVLTDFAVIG